MNRLILAAALIAGISFQLVKDFPPAPMIIAWKGAGVALLAIWAGSQARDRDGWLIAIALAFGALGDVLLETSGTVPGALFAFKVPNKAMPGVERFIADMLWLEPASKEEK